MLSDFTADIESQYNINPKELARGSYGVVNEAHRKKDNLHVAIKTLSESVDLVASKYLLRELQLLATVNHPKCLRLISFTLSPVPKIVTPFMGNGTLNDVITKLNAGKPDPKFPPTKMMCAIYGICSAMQFLHDKSIIHRDFKPLNVFLDDNYDICIADFGLSRRAAENVNMTMGNVGSPLYMAPEIFTDEYESYTNKVDVFAFGVTYLQFFTKLENLNDKKPKFKSSSNLLMRISRGARFVQPETANDEQYKVYVQCTLPNPNERPSFEELCEYFEKTKEVWFDGVDEDEYYNYIADCKKIIEQERELQKEAEQMKLNELTDLSGSMRLSSSKTSSSGKKHKRYY